MDIKVVNQLVDIIRKKKHINDVHRPNANAGGFSSIAGQFQAALNDRYAQDLGMALISELVPNAREKGLFEAFASHDRGALYVHDRGHLHLPYCYSFNFSRLLYEKCNFGRLVTTPVKRLDSYVSVVSDCVSVFSQQIAGAVGIGSFFIDAGKLLRKQPFASQSYIQNCFQQFIHSVNHLARGNESAFTNVSVLDENSLRNMPIVEPEDIRHILKAQELFLELFLEGDPLEGGRPFTFPIVTVNVSGDPYNNRIVEACSDHVDRVNWNITDESKFSMCCRLQFSPNDLKNLAQEVNSFSASPLEVGSHRVVSINFNHAALYSSLALKKGVAGYWKRLERMFDQAEQFIKLHREFLEILISDGALPLFDLGWMSMSRLFGTIGIIGLVEAAETLRRPTLVRETLDWLNQRVAESGLRLNIEQVPGEEARFALARKTNQEFGTDYVLYSNQFASLHDEQTFIQKMRIEGEAYHSLTGGGIGHFRLPEKPPARVVPELLERAASYNCRHFAFSTVYSICGNGHCVLGKHDVCPECGTEVVDYLERVIGYFAPVSSWGKNSQQHDFNNRKFLYE